MDPNGFDNYALHTLRLQSTKSGEPELNKSGEKFQDNNEFIIQNTGSDVR